MGNLQRKDQPLGRIAPETARPNERPKLAEPRLGASSRSPLAGLQQAQNDCLRFTQHPSIPRSNELKATNDTPAGPHLRIACRTSCQLTVPPFEGFRVRAPPTRQRWWLVDGRTSACGCPSRGCRRCGGCRHPARSGPPAAPARLCLRAATSCGTQPEREDLSERADLSMPEETGAALGTSSSGLDTQHQLEAGAMIRVDCLHRSFVQTMASM